MMTNSLHTAVRKYDDVEKNGHQTQDDDDKAQYDDCFYYIHSLWSYTVHQHWNTCNVAGTVSNKVN